MALTEPEVLAALREAGIKVQLGLPVENTAQALRAINELGYPVWIRSTGPHDPGYCARLQSGDDLPLVVGQALRRSGNGQALVQPALEGAAFRVGRPCIAQLYFPDTGIYRLAEAMTTVQDQSSLEYLRALLAELSQEAEVILTSEGPCIVRLRPMRSEPQGEWARIAVAAGPAAVCWLQARSGSVVRVDGLEKTDADTVAVGVGARLTHILDEDARDSLGYVFRKGATVEEALAHARAACDNIQLVTTALLD